MTRDLVRVARLRDLPLGEGRVARVGDTPIALFRLAERDVCAIGASCPHRGGPLADGIVSGRTVSCPLHGWRVDLDTGLVLGEADARVRVYGLRLSGGDVLLAAPGLVASVRR